MEKKNYVIGIDYGSDSARGVLVDADSGRQIAAHTSLYKRWGKGMWCDASREQYRQHPLDYIEALEEVMKSIISECDDPSAIRAIGMDGTASTPCLVDKHLTPLCMLPGHEDDPNAMFVLWKDHTGAKECDEIIAHAKGTPYLSHNGNTYSAEHFWSKALHTLRSSEALRADAWTAVDLCDYIPALLTGCKDASQLRLSHCAAGAKWMWGEEWGGWAPREWYTSLDPILGPFYDHLPAHNYQVDEPAGKLCPEWAERLGLSTDVVVCVGNLDAYSGSIGAGVAYKRVAMSMGTSACYICSVPNEKIGGRIVDGLFGQVDGMVLRDQTGLDAGLSAYGDAFAWFKRLLSWAGASDPDSILPRLGEEADKLPLRADAPLATDHFNGRRCPKLSSTITASIMGLNLSTTAPEIYYALVEACSFGTKVIIDHLEANDAEIDEFVAVGGISQKSPFAMQLMADVLGRTINVSGSKDAAALGSAIYAATAAGIHKSVADAQAVMCPPVIRSYHPRKERQAVLAERYARYLAAVKFNEEH